MGMAIVEKQLTYGELMHGRYPNTNHCRKCDAIYTPSKHWCRGYTDKGTVGEFYPTSKVPENKCPICLEPQQEDK